MKTRYVQLAAVSSTGTAFVPFARGWSGEPARGGEIGPVSRERLRHNCTSHNRLKCASCHRLAAGVRGSRATAGSDPRKAAKSVGRVVAWWSSTRPPAAGHRIEHAEEHMDARGPAAVPDAVPDASGTGVAGHGTNSWAALVAMLCGTFLGTLNNNIVNVPLRDISQGYGVDPSQGVLVVVSFLLVFSVMMPLTGWLGDRLGRRRVFCWAMVGLTVGRDRRRDRAVARRPRRVPRRPGPGDGRRPAHRDGADRRHLHPGPQGAGARVLGRGQRHRPGRGAAGGRVHRGLGRLALDLRTHRARGVAGAARDDARASPTTPAAPSRSTGAAPGA